MPIQTKPSFFSHDTLTHSSPYRRLHAQEGSVVGRFRRSASFAAESEVARRPKSPSNVAEHGDFQERKVKEAGGCVAFCPKKYFDEIFSSKGVAGEELYQGTF
mmetsp:Transcript_18506/g.48993  ORF Transcript_18506/g.48993 Transcript_18506/m.48993 type:complete len:103 (+) Transcript_18506:108-416(+)